MRERQRGAPASQVTTEYPPGTRWRTLLVISVVAAVVVGGGWWVTRPVMTGGAAGNFAAVQVASAGASPKVGSRAPDFTVSTTDGRALTLSQLRGTRVWLNFGATWCAPCRVEAPDLQAAHATVGDGVQIVAVYLGEDKPAIDKFTSSLGLTYTHVPDPNKALASAWGVNGIPVHWFIDADGVIRATQVGILGPDRITELLNQLR